MKSGTKTIIAGGVTFLLGGFVLPFLFILPLILGHQQDTRFKAPGTMEVSIKEPGRYYIWNDFRTIYNGRSYNRPETIPDGLEFQIRDSDNHQLQLVNDASISSSTGSSAKKSIGYVQVEHPGKVTIQVSGGEEERILSFSQSGLLKMFGLILGGVGVSIIGAISGLSLIIWGIVKLARANRSGEPNATPNSSPAQWLGNSGGGSLPPSVS